MLENITHVGGKMQVTKPT